MRSLCLPQSRPRVGAARPKRGQEGIVLIVALLVLVGLTIASIGLLRSVDSGATVAGNLGFKKDMYRQSNRGVQAALTNLAPIRSADGELPLVDAPAASYYATAQLLVDDRGVPLALVNAPLPSAPGIGTGWPGEFSVPIGDPSGGGYLFRYTAERLCPNTGAQDDVVNPCRKAAGPGTASPPGSRDPGLPLPGSVYVRLTLRVDGPKNSVSYFQAMLL